MPPSRQMSPSLRRGTVPVSGVHVHASPSLPPSILGAAERSNACPTDGFLLPEAATPSAPPAAAAGGRSAAGRPAGRIPTAPNVPSAPPARPVGSPPPLFASESSIAPDESYGADEKALNSFVGLHPMLSMGKTRALKQHSHLTLTRPLRAQRQRPTRRCSSLPRCLRRRACRWPTCKLHSYSNSNLNTPPPPLLVSSCAH